MSLVQDDGLARLAAKMLDEHVVRNREEPRTLASPGLVSGRRHTHEHFLHEVVRDVAAAGRASKVPAKRPTVLSDETRDRPSDASVPAMPSYNASDEDSSQVGRDPIS